MTRDASVWVLRRPLDVALAATDMVRALRDEPGLCALVGDWCDGGVIVAYDPVCVADDPFVAVDDVPAADGVGFGGGWIGYLGYQLGRRIEWLPPAPQRPTPLPDSHLAYYDRVLRFDAATRSWWFEALATAEREDELDREYERLRQRLEDVRPERRPYSVSPFTMTPDPERHRSVVATTLDHIGAGDIFQANLCTRLEATFDGDPLDAFCAGVDALRPRFAAYVTTPAGAIASLSPELFLRRTGRAVRTSPIKGTAALTSDPRDLAASWKNRAENIMIVDLMRNDIGRVCRPGTVWVPDQPRAERHTGVWHLVSDVVGRLDHGVGDGDLLRATFPPGSVTGAPKVRAMEIINTLEQTGRETYTGVVGYVSPAAGLELNVAIRTFEFRGDTMWLGVGGGIVADSQPADELRECLVKAQPLLDAIGAELAEDVVVGAGTRAGSPIGHSTTAHAAPSERRSHPDPDEGVFETVYVDGGRVWHFDAHLDRLSASFGALYGRSLPGGLADRVTAEASSLVGPHRMRISVVPSESREAIASTPIGSAAPPPWRLVPAVVVGGFGAHKWCDRSLLDAIEPEPGTWTADRDALLVDVDGSVLETARGSLFIVDDHAVHTPEADGRILPGTARRRVLDQLGAAGVPAYERRIGLEELAAAHEVFVTNAVRGAVPVAECAGVGTWPPGPTTAWVAERLSGPAPDSPRVSPPARRVLLIDNYDSFVYNLDQYCRELGADTEVVRNDAVSVDEIEERVRRGEVERIVISPGPGTPGDAGISTEVVRRLAPHVPILGVCLGHQCIGEAYGAVVRRAPSVVHGKSSLVRLLMRFYEPDCG
ncbi:MAG: aminodeoxychorismate synthase component I, partial [Actinomycetia bacterium]|nr:aminodeoxychorismate synthase component I [Actinomycetes bacterium]